MIRQQDKPYIEAITKIQGKNVTSEQIERAVYQVNQESGFVTCYTGQQVISIMIFCGVIQITSHLGQPRQGGIINGGRLHDIRVLSWV